ncbi:uncharacterized protein LOC122393211 [Amphibalanus amphitrite]|uniref:uncharacterized protein LOC122393211 n=1 Tax=Amphibalanus amphitrite TaxID=1232801 RepID=UPI001C90AE74|nr:uncharacterized protein LOC122393211 [Amphibalanus amphitrite]
MSRPQTYCVRRAERIKNLYRGINWRVRTLVRKYESCAHLIPDTLLFTDDICNSNCAWHQAHCAKFEVSHSVDRLIGEPLMAALLDVNDAAAARCRHCQPDQPLRLTSINGSGSNVEGLSDGVVGQGGTSDFDLMFEFDGPFRWAALGKREEPGVISRQSAPQLWARPTKNPGFVTLHWAKTTKCSHEKALEALPSHTMRNIMLNFSRVLCEGEISTAGPAVNVKSPYDITDGGTDHVPCILVRGWWPAEGQLDGCQLEADFPPAAAWDNIRRFGVHLVPTGRPGSDTEFIEFLISFSRAELVAIRHLAPVIRAAIKAVKGMKGILKKSEVMTDEVKFKSYFIKTAGLWVAQTTPVGMLKGITDGVHKILDWLEENFAIGRLPCFFDHNIDVTAELSTKERRDIIDTIRLMREHATLLLMAVCEDQWRNVDLLLEGGTEPLSERELRLRLLRTLVQQAVVDGVGYRPTAPWWEYWWKASIPPLVRTAPLLLQWWHYSNSGTYNQQCYLFMAWVVVDPADLVGETLMTSSVSDIVTLDVTPLIQLLTRSDLEFLLGDPDRVATWCSLQLRRPLEERPAGLTAELDTPRGRAELLLRPELLLQAVRVNAPGKMDMWRDEDRRMKNWWMGNAHLPMRTYQETRELLEQFFNTNLHWQLRDLLPEMDAVSVATTAGLKRRRLQQLLSGDRLRTAYDAATGWWPDRWEMTPYCLAVDETDSQDSERDDDNGEVGGEERRGADEKQTMEGLPRPQREKWQQLERQHQQLWQELDRRGYEKKKSLNQQHDEECRSMERRHDKKWRSMEMRHHDERKSLQQRHESVTMCVELQNQEHSNQERRRRHLELLDRKNRRDRAVLERQHQIEWGDLEQKVQRQWNKLKQRHQSESQELKERYPNIRTGEELARLMEECSRRRQHLGEELGKELEKELELELEKELGKVQEEELENGLKLEEDEEPLVRAPKNHERQQKQQQHGQQQRQQQQQHQEEEQRQGRQPSRNVEHLRNLIEVTRRHRQQRIQLQERHNQELEEQRRRHRHERKDLERRLGCRRNSQERRHGK